MVQQKIDKVKNSVWIGLLIGLVIPAVLLVIVWSILQQVKVIKADLFYIGCIAVNAYTMQVFFKHNKENVGRGILSATFLWAFAFFFYKIS